ncbi:MAG: response regulator [Chitinivibrionales bacterium]|nr:response regulator [Chitinivibrionales bacterium]
MHKILIVDDSKNFCAMMQDFFTSRYEVGTVRNGEAALERCRNEHFDMVISDINMPGIQGPELLQRIKETWPGIRTILITSYSIDSYITIARRYNISSIMPKTVPFNFSELATMVDGLLTGDIFGLSRYLLPDAEIDTCTITSSRESRKIRETIVGVLSARFEGAGDMKLLLDETITNAIYHAPRNPDGSVRYREFTEVELEPHEYVQIEYGYDEEKYGVSVSDNLGKLKKEVVLERIDRHTAGQGILDDSGRGIHMSRLFADRMFVNIHPEVKTEVVLVNYISKKYKGYKPLYVNEL